MFRLIILTFIIDFCLANEISNIVLDSNNNGQKHHTDQYSQLVLRRGEQFRLFLYTRFAYNYNTDRFRFEFLFKDEAPIYIPLGNNSNYHKESTSWSANLKEVTSYNNQDKLTVLINLPTNIAVGQWHLRVSVKLLTNNAIKTFIFREPIYILFNPWNSNDDAYMAREDGRKEYVLNEIGKIYVGTLYRPTGRQWNYGQFHESVLPVIVYLLDRTRLTYAERANIVQVSRAISAIVNSHDDNGLLVGDWSGSYGDGLAPWQWSGSAPIFTKYYQTARPVRFAQCWVFGGVTTTISRALGIPARTISNFKSAHDTDASLTVDRFYSEHGDQLKGINNDSIWNFHVWTDAWMARRDLPPGYGGWQAIDATPQETSSGKYQLGPASLEAIKQGRVNFAYDVGFVFSEVNAGVVDWYLDRRSRWQWRRKPDRGNHVGVKMLTKKIGILGINDAENIVYQYKQVEGSREAELAYQNAILAAGLGPIFNDS